MPLSEHEQKLLDQMERALYAEDPSFASQMKGRGGPTSRTRHILGGVAAILGLALVVVGVSMASIPLGVLGFAVMIGGVIWALTPSASGTAGRQAPAGNRQPRPSQSRKQRPGGNFMGRMEQRWEKRRREGEL
ncbi:hypothetical protein KEM60_02333 [Austwickia sp. TVS 96-490-7B]|uniref:DUF3040 domain-containing protein n=1 Tax=Austwickia sp. TVS 96-490-7B TaxID=2830843 RepID=UPI001C56A6AA|nr:DUF3040 domain-containing protein [Austwickia sp. TVS 96-490-7B]MBW3086122.1 hypothetical protein [Austwickia sp. TVS 96-490-7B]